MRTIRVSLFFMRNHLDLPIQLRRSFMHDIKSLAETCTKRHCNPNVGTMHLACNWHPWRRWDLESGTGKTEWLQWFFNLNMSQLIQEPVLRHQCKREPQQQISCPKSQVQFLAQICPRGVCIWMSKLPSKGASINMSREYRGGSSSWPAAAPRECNRKLLNKHLNILIWL